MLVPESSLTVPDDPALKEITTEVGVEVTVGGATVEVGVAVLTGTLVLLGVKVTVGAATVEVKVGVLDGTLVLLGVKLAVGVALGVKVIVGVSVGIRTVNVAPVIGRLRMSAGTPLVADAPPKVAMKVPDATLVKL